LNHHFARWTSQVPILLLFALASCGSAIPGTERTQPNLESGTASSGQSGAQTQSKGSAMTEPQDCQSDNMHKSMCMIRLILEDVEKTYGGEENGGISNIHAESSTSLTVTIPREERSTSYTYEFEFAADGGVTIKSKKESTKSY
jgi:hypothetical protein